MIRWLGRGLWRVRAVRVCGVSVGACVGGWREGLDFLFFGDRYLDHELFDVVDGVHVAQSVLDNLEASLDNVTHASVQMANAAKGASLPQSSQFLQQWLRALRPSNFAAFSRRV